MALRLSFIQIFQHSLRAWWDDNALRLGASLSFYTLFAIAPVLLVSIAIAGLVFGAEAVRGELVGQMDGLVGRDGAEAVQALLEGASKRQSPVGAAIAKPRRHPEMRRHEKDVSQGLTSPIGAKVTGQRQTPLFQLAKAALVILRRVV